MNIAFCINRLALIGLGVTVSSLIRNCSDTTKLSIWFLGTDLNSIDKERISQLLKRENYMGKHHIIDLHLKADFGEFRSLHGDWTAYGRLILCDIINEERVLYLDADLVVELDVLEAENIYLNNYALGAVNGCELSYALDGAFIMREFGLSSKSIYFNSGILLIDLNKWRSRKIKEKCLEIARKYPMDLLSHDQTLLNIIFANNYERLPDKFNCPWLSFSQRPNTSEKMIIHFVGSPKPWDIGGKIFHGGYYTWKGYLEKEWAKYYYHINTKDISRAWKIRRSYINSLVKKIRS
jgi:lipopolysaccharide biosynthesis glycosyltransferase